MTMQHLLIAALLSGCTASQAQAELFDRGSGLVYDDALNVTWLQDASLGGNMNWDDAVAWADNLVFAGFDDWRLPSIDVNGDGSIVNCPSEGEGSCLDNELGYMYYVNLMGNAFDDLTGDQAPIENIQFDHWSDTELLGTTDRAWYFLFFNGAIGADNKSFDNAAWAVRPGDVLSGQDTDANGIDDNLDNCLSVANAAQRDSDGDSIGNFCDPDVAVPNDCIVNFLDLAVYSANFFQNGDFDTDNNGDDITNFLDLLLVRQQFFGPPGPSAYGCN